MPIHKTTLRSYRLRTSVGIWEVAFSDAGLCQLSLPGSPKNSGVSGKARPVLANQEGRLGKQLQKIVKARLEGKRGEFPWVAMDLSGHPPFFSKVLEVLYHIPFGQTRTYGWVAEEAESPMAMRAAGQACGSNPIALLIPCHRVLAANGPGGFGAGMEWKATLLALEGVTLER